jgi:hypothetical protein
MKSFLDTLTGAKEHHSFVPSPQVGRTIAAAAGKCSQSKSGDCILIWRV